MPRSPLLERALSKFGAGDQIHFVDYETMGRVVADIKQIRIDEGLRVEFENSTSWDSRGINSKPRPDFVLWFKPSVDDLMVHKSELGFVEIVNPVTDDVIQFVKKKHRAYRRQIKVSS